MSEFNEFIGCRYGSIKEAQKDFPWIQKVGDQDCEPITESLGRLLLKAIGFRIVEFRQLDESLYGFVELEMILYGQLLEREKFGELESRILKASQLRRDYQGTPST